MHSLRSKQRDVYTLRMQDEQRDNPFFVKRRNESYAKHITTTYGWEHKGEYPGSHHPANKTFFLPHDTLVMCTEEAKQLGIHSENDFYGGLVPEPFLATKVIMHPLVSAHAHRPHGWTDIFVPRANNHVPVGYAVFSKQDAKQAAELLLRVSGAVRGKDPRGTGGLGQIVLRTRDEIEAVIETLDELQLGQHGYIFERHLQITRSLSIGQSKINGDLISYYGFQRQNYLSEERTEYTGSDLIVVRGDYAQLCRTDPLAANLAHAIEQVAAFQSALSTNRNIMVSRLNIDIIQGYDAKDGKWFSIPTDPSLRAGGAPDIHALAVMKQHPALKRVSASSYIKFYQDGEENPQIPEEAMIHFHEQDEQFRPGKTLLVYSIVRA